ncbi:MAG: hypothetical protein EXR62_13640 [Chloroflexi bacterium]|nr:hypothetical protein [Chloroflexota bacterium]
MTYHPITVTIQDLLTQHNLWFETFEHEPVRTSEEAAKTRPGYTLEQGAKAIIIQLRKSGGEKEFAMLVMPADKRFDNTKVKALLGADKIRFATEEEISQLTDGIQPGGVPPFGNLFSLEVFADPTLFENEKIVFNAGDRRFSLAMKAADYQVLVKPKVVSIL